MFFLVIFLVSGAVQYSKMAINALSTIQSNGNLRPQQQRHLLFDYHHTYWTNEGKIDKWDKRVFDKCDRHNNMRFQFQVCSKRHTERKRESDRESTMALLEAAIFFGLLIRCVVRRTNGHLHVIINSLRLFQSTKTQYCPILMCLNGPLCVYSNIVVVCLMYPKYVHIHKKWGFWRWKWNRKPFSVRLLKQQNVSLIHLLFYFVPWNAFRSSDQYLNNKIN